jgi:putative ABC transport system substrate-binding protein
VLVDYAAHTNRVYSDLIIGEEPLAADLVRHKAAAIVAPISASALAAKAATSTIPIVGLVAGLNIPGGNATGVSLLTVELQSKRLEVPREVIPNVSAIGVFVNPAPPTIDTQLRELQDAAHSLGSTW